MRTLHSLDKTAPIVNLMRFSLGIPHLPCPICLVSSEHIAAPRHAASWNDLTALEHFGLLACLSEALAAGAKGFAASEEHGHFHLRLTTATVPRLTTGGADPLLPLLTQDIDRVEQVDLAVVFAMDIWQGIDRTVVARLSWSWWAPPDRRWRLHGRDRAGSPATFDGPGRRRSLCASNETGQLSPQGVALSLSRSLRCGHRRIVQPLSNGFDHRHRMKPPLGRRRRCGGDRIRGAAQAPQTDTSDRRVDHALRRASSPNAVAGVYSTAARRRVQLSRP